MHARSHRSGKSTVLCTAALLVLLGIIGCKHRESSTGFLGLTPNRLTSGKSEFPVAIDPSKVGTYVADTKSGAGYFYDDVLEYRVWLHPDRGAVPLNGDKDYFIAFAQYEMARGYSNKTSGAESVLVLVRQRQWIDEPQPGKYIPMKGERITEWDVAWLQGSKRDSGSIEEFLKHPRPERTSASDADESNSDQ